jgi:protein-S-isoprenylcysteine O-methyltransferase Ste14
MSAPTLPGAPAASPSTVSAPDGDVLRRVQLIRKGVLLAAIIGLLALSVLSDRAYWSEATTNGFRMAGLGLIGLSIIGRAWCSLYIGGRKTAEIVDRGPYSLTRNPLYVFSFIGALGMGLETGSLVLTALFVVVAVGVFYATVKREEAWLAAAFGATYAAYRLRTPRFWPRLSAWRDVETLEIRPDRFLMTLADGSALLLAVPLFAAIGWMQSTGWMNVAVSLP